MKTKNKNNSGFASVYTLLVMILLVATLMGGLMTTQKLSFENLKEFSIDEINKNIAFFVGKDQIKELVAQLDKATK